MDPYAPMPQGENAPVQNDQSSASDPIFNLPPSQTQLDQLPPGDNPMLPLGQLPNRNSRLVTRRGNRPTTWHNGRPTTRRNALSVG